MLKIGPIPEVAIFAFEWGSPGFPHEEWLDWMERNKLGYGRVYPESGSNIGGPEDTEISLNSNGRLYPFNIDHWKDGQPIFDLSEFNPQYWDNFGRIIKECADKGIVLQMQLYQRVYFHPTREEEGYPNRWQINYFNPENNINKYPVPEGRGGYGLFPAMAENSVWKEIHTKWVKHILTGIGRNGNVIIDLMNEGSFKGGNLTKEWVEYTLDIIEKWEDENRIDILTGFDFDHIFKIDDHNLEYILSHPRMDVLIWEGSEGHVVPELVAGDRKTQTRSLAIEFRHKYRKPVISTNSPSYSVSIAEDTWKLHFYQWYSMMTKVQGVGVYAKEFPIDFSNLVVKEYAKRSIYLAEFFDGIEDYGKLNLASEIIAKAPGKYQLALASEDEMVIYLHSGNHMGKFREGEKLVLESSNMRNVKYTSINVFHPSSGESLIIKGKYKNNRLSLKLPAFHNDIAIHITETPDTQGHTKQH